jgi:hypothetical protein
VVPLAVLAGGDVGGPGGRCQRAVPSGGAGRWCWRAVVGCAGGQCRRVVLAGSAGGRCRPTVPVGTGWAAPALVLVGGGGRRCRRAALAGGAGGGGGGRPAGVSGRRCQQWCSSPAQREYVTDDNTDHVKSCDQASSPSSEASIHALAMPYGEQTGGFSSLVKNSGPFPLK